MNIISYRVPNTAKAEVATVIRKEGDAFKVIDRESGAVLWIPAAWVIG